MNVVILTYESFESAYIIAYLLQQKSINVSAIIKSSTIIYKKDFLQQLGFILTGVSINFIFFKFIENLIWHLSTLISSKKRVKTLDQLHNQYKIKIIKTSDINSPEMIREVSKLNPEIIVSVYFNQKVGKNILKLTDIAALNLHPAFLPGYRGLFPYFWVLKK